MPDRQLRILLFGDSIFNNRKYVPEYETVLRQVESIAGGVVLGLAVDGRTTESYAVQVRDQKGLLSSKLKEKYFDDVPAAFVSLGINDVLHFMREIKVLNLFQKHDPIEVLHERTIDFMNAYEDVVAYFTQELELPTTFCTIYNSAVEDKELFSVIQGLFNDVIMKVTSRWTQTTLELRDIFTEQDDYINFVEPSANGGKKLANAIHERAVEIETYIRAIEVVGPRKTGSVDI